MSLLAMPVLSILLPPIGIHNVRVQPVSAVLTASPAQILTAPTTVQLPARRTPWITMLWAAGAPIVLGRLAGGMIRLTLLNGQPVEVLTTITVNFRLKP